MNGHCQKCNREWSGNSEAHCGRCCEHFTSDKAFDRHLARSDSDEVCHHPSTVTKKDGKSLVFESVEKAHGPTWRFIDERENPFIRAGAIAGAAK